MANADYPAALREMDEVNAAGHPLGVEAIALKIRQRADIAPAFETLKNDTQRSMLLVNRSAAPTT